MPKLYIANCTKQKREFHYRIPGNPNQQLFTLRLDPFKQEALPHDLPMDALKRIVEPHEQYGFSPVSSINRETQFVGVAYSFDKEIPQDLIHYTVERNGGVLDDMALEDRKRNVAAFDTNPDAVRSGMHPGTVEQTIEETPDASNPSKPLKSEIVTTKARHTG